MTDAPSSADAEELARVRAIRLECLRLALKQYDSTAANIGYAAGIFSELVINGLAPEYERERTAVAEEPAA